MPERIVSIILKNLLIVFFFLREITYETFLDTVKYCDLNAKHQHEFCLQNNFQNWRRQVDEQRISLFFSTSSSRLLLLNSLGLIRPFLVWRGFTYFIRCQEQFQHETSSHIIRRERSKL